MNTEVRKRLVSLEAKAGIGLQTVIVFLGADEEPDEKVNRWKAGEEVDGVSAGPSETYSGGQLSIIAMRPIGPKLDVPDWSGV